MKKIFVAFMLCLVSIMCWSEKKCVFTEVVAHHLNVYQHEVFEKTYPYDVPKIFFNIPYDAYGNQYDANINFEGKFSNGDNISVNGSIVLLDGRKIKQVKYYKYDVNWFLEHLQVNSIVRVIDEYDQSIYEDIVINEEQYNAIIKFYKK